ncbi:Autophagy-related protein 22-2 [Golovinomyces cichoracearum]|uniref:Autophagy-related protein n=1 Tax=Golovinomyces cichoracearum TaxID=62708 RepID=A0A420IFB2_9PEZI|nr:Autophagy-related protein 22-2 [Golovinomyces cichoracearum]
MIPDDLPHSAQLHPLAAKRSSSVYSTQSVRSYKFSSYEADDERSSGNENVCPELDGTFIPITLEQLARENGVLQSDNTTPCESNSFHSSRKPSSSGSNSTETCLGYILGIPVNTFSFAM